MGRATDALKRVPTAEYGPLKRAQDAIAVLLAKSAHLQLIHTPGTGEVRRAAHEKNLAETR